MAQRPNNSHAQNQVLYASQFLCAICQKRNVQVHHIDRNNKNNDTKNLIVLCQAHHDEAHTQKGLTINLSAQRLRAAKKQWEEHVTAYRKLAVSCSAQRRAAGEFLGLGVSWGYINHRRVSGIIKPQILESVDQELLLRCINRGLVDRNGLIISPPNRILSDNYLRNSIYDYFEFGDDHRIHSLYEQIVDEIALRANPLHITDESFKKSWIRDLISPGKYLFINRGHYFKDIDRRSGNITKLAYTKKRKVRFEFMAETRDMFGTSSMTVSFAGRKSVASLVVVKSVEHNDVTTVYCTPIAMGTGQWPLTIENTMIPSTVQIARIEGSVITSGDGT